MALSKAVNSTVNAILAVVETTAATPLNDTGFPREAAVGRPDGAAQAAAFHDPLVGLVAIIGAFVVLAALIVALVRLRPRRRHASPEDELYSLGMMDAS
ncbi:unnamed protein product [Lampetra planeri]